MRHSLPSIDLQGVGAAPGLAGNSDTNSVKSPTLPYLRSIDGFSTTDAAFANSIAGGITSMQVLPGSGTKAIVKTTYLAHSDAR